MRSSKYDSHRYHRSGTLNKKIISGLLLIAAVIFFNYVASVTRIGAGYVGVEIVLSGSQPSSVIKTV